MNNLYILMLLTFSNYLASGQHETSTLVDPCSQLLYYKSKLYQNYPYERYYDFINVYVDQNYTGLNKYISHNENELIRLNKKTFNAQNISFSKMISDSNTIIINILFMVDSLLINTDTIDKDDYLIFESVLADSLGYDYFGFVKKSSIAHVTQLECVNVISNNKRHIINFDFLKEIVNPNIHHSLNKVKSIEAYYDPKMKSTYIYMYGLIPEDLSEISDWDASSSYVAKIIINESEIHKIIIPGGYLFTYGWLNCPSFWPL